MQKTRLEAFTPLDLKDALLVVAFPTTGSAGPIAARFLQERLELPLVGHVRVAGLDGVAAVQDGIATTPIRVYGGEVACRLEGGCPRLYLITTELALPPEAIRSVAKAVLQSAHEGQARLVLCLEGVVRQLGDETPDVYVAAATGPTLDELKATTEAPAASRAILVGMSASCLLGEGTEVPAGAIIVEARRDYPDGRAAAALISVLDRLIPDIHVDPQPLLEEAMKLERQIQQAQETAKDQGTRHAQSTFI